MTDVTTESTSELVALRPVQCKAEHLSGRELEKLPPWSPDVVIRDITSNRGVEWYTGEQITSMIVEAGDGMIQLTDLAIDELIVVLDGDVTFTSADGNQLSFTKGDVGMIPKGWTGTMDCRNGYRELMCSNSAALSGGIKEWVPEYYNKK